MMSPIFTPALSAGLSFSTPSTITPAVFGAPKCSRSSGEMFTRLTPM
jgi:hypothetical protein